MQFIFLRHAPTSWNEHRLLQGKSNIPLSDNGRKLARQKQLPADLSKTITACYTSPLKRAVETAEIICHPLHIKIIPDERLQEMSFGIWEGQKLYDIRYRLRFIMHRLEQRGRYFSAPKGENPFEVGERLMNFFNNMWRFYDGEGNILCVAHKGVIRSLYSLAVGWDMTCDAKDELDFDCLQIFNYDGKEIRVEKLNVHAQSKNGQKKKKKPVRQHKWA